MYRGIKFKVSLKYLHRFCKGKCSFKDVTVSFCERFKGFLTNNSKKRSYLDIIIHKTQAAVKLPLSPAAIELLGKPKKKGLVFPNLSGYKLSFYIPRLLKLAKIEKHITFHCFRHTFAMRLLGNGVDIYTIATLFGHKTVTSTQVYARLSQAQIRQAVMKL